MKRKFKKQTLIADINITPFTDVILVLLVIFMITTPLMYQTRLEVKLPDAQSGLSMQDLKASKVYVTITHEGVVYLDKAVVTRKELRDKIGALHAQNPDVHVVLAADKLVRFKDVVEALDIFNELGITKLDIAATKPQ